MTKQQTFDMVISALRKQNKRSINEQGNSLYRSPDGCKCAVGHLIPDNYYHYSLEGHGAYSDVIGQILNQLGHNLLLCRQLQIVHDYIEIENWSKHFNRIAIEHKLIYDYISKNQSKLDNKGKEIVKWPGIK